MVAIFVITVMALLASALLRVVEDSSEAVTIEVWGTRALAAANSAADRGLSQLFPIAGGVAGCAVVAPSWDIGTDTGLVGFHGCQVTIGCTQQTINTVSEFRINANAVCSSADCNSSGGSCIRVSRQVEVGARSD
ncbi:MSHA biogenesis protein MshP [Paraferrimonas sedimenticola]|uniref:MSHA biogenesis protein MshP n=1 Tax=Paraferrimonas sedimenticola TaxID=375674 RepID=A0AA37VZM8_9GAMM|nr:MSHA biogenesis protein MshP [Paraferrimonas sedimenticola]